VRSTSPREDCERDECQRIELRGRADAQGYKAERAVPAQQSEEREQHQSCRPEVVALDNERWVERERQGRGHEYPSGQLGRAGARQKENSNEKGDRSSAEGKHKEAETVVIAVVRRPGCE
jgi:hypothetical protein